MKDLKAMMGKDDSGDQMKKDAKLTVLKQLRKMAADMVGGDVKDGMEGMKKVTVAAPDKAGLAEGLAKAKQMMGGGDDSSDDSDASDMGDMDLPADSDDQDSADHDESMDQDDQDMTPEEIQKKIQDLQMMLKMKSR